jgi:transposase
MNSLSHAHVTRPQRANSTSARTQRTQHRPSQQEAQTSQPDYLNLPGVRTLSEPDCDDFCIRVEAEQIWYQMKCSNPGCESDVRPNGTRWQNILDEPRGLNSVKIRLRRRSYKCGTCAEKKVKQDAGLLPFDGSVEKQVAGLLPLDCLAERRGMTRWLLDYLENQSLQRRSFRELAQEVGRSDRTVREIFWRRVAQSEGERKASVKAPRVLGIDGVYIERKERPILTDIEGKTIIDIWETVKTAELTSELEKLPEREKVQVVVMDMAKPLKAAVEIALPKAVIVIDRYHIQRMANEAMDKVRNRLRQRGRHRDEPTMCKSSLLRKHPHQLKGKENEELEWWFDEKPELRAAYELKERFFAIWHTRSKAEAQKSYRQWRLSVPQKLKRDFAKLIKAMTNWGGHIFNYFDHNHTNAFTESTNRIVKDIQREARHGSFETIKAKVIYGTIARRQMRAARERDRDAKPKRRRSGKAGGALVPEMPMPLTRQPALQMHLSF